MNALEFFFLFLVQISLEYILRGLVDNNIAFIQVMVCPWTGKKSTSLLSELTMNYSLISLQFSYCYIRYLLWNCIHDEVMTWKHFLRYWPFVRGNPLVTLVIDWRIQRAVRRSFDVFFEVRLNKQLDKQQSCQWSETLWCLCDIAVMLIVPSSNKRQPILTNCHNII